MTFDQTILLKISCFWFCEIVGWWWVINKNTLNETIIPCKVENVSTFSQVRSRRGRNGGGGGSWTGEDFGRHSVWPHRRSGRPQMSWQVWSGFVGQAVIECSTNGALLSSRSGGNCPRSRWPRPCRPPSRPSRTPCCRGPLAPLEGKEKKEKLKWFSIRPKTRLRF